MLRSGDEKEEVRTSTTRRKGIKEVFSSNGCAGGGTELGTVDFIKMSKKGRLARQTNRFIRAMLGRIFD